MKNGGKEGKEKGMKWGGGEEREEEGGRHAIRTGLILS